jgi:hypothetical protein
MGDRPRGLDGIYTRDGACVMVPRSLLRGEKLGYFFSLVERGIGLHFSSCALLITSSLVNTTERHPH